MTSSSSTTPRPSTRHSPEIELLNPQALPTGYFAEIGFVGNDKTGAVPGPDTVWSVDGNPTLTPSTPVTLTYTNDKGLTFKRTFSVDDNYMFTVSDTVQNSGSSAVSLSNYGRVTRYDKPAVASTYVLHEGLIGVTGTEGLAEYKYAKIEKEKQVTPGKSTDGWLGITDKYWAVTLVPTEKQPFQPRYRLFRGRPPPLPVRLPHRPDHCRRRPVARRSRRESSPAPRKSPRSTPMRRTATSASSTC